MLGKRKNRKRPGAVHHEGEKDPEMLLSRLLEDKPKFHKMHDGTPKSWAVTPETLKVMFGMLTPGMTTLETGAGHTTVAFALAGTNHTCITPAAEEVVRIKDYLEKLGIGDNVVFINRSSDIALAEKGAIPDELDFVFIDGAHRFPFPAIDWHYTYRKLRIGGIIGIDDIQIPTVRLLYEFLSVEDEWELVNTTGRTAFFKKAAQQIRKGDWKSQKTNLILESSLTRPIDKP